MTDIAVKKCQPRQFKNSFDSPYTISTCLISNLIRIFHAFKQINSKTTQAQLENNNYFKLFADSSDFIPSIL